MAMTREELQAEVERMVEEFGLELEGDGLTSDLEGTGEEPEKAIGIGFKLTDATAQRLEEDLELGVKVRRAKLALIQKVSGSKATFRYEEVAEDDIRVNPEQPMTEVKMADLVMQSDELRMVWGMAQIGGAFSAGMLALSQAAEDVDPGSQEGRELMAEILHTAVSEMGRHFPTPQHVTIAQLKLSEFTDMLHFAQQDVDLERDLSTWHGKEEITLADFGIEDTDA